MRDCASDRGGGAVTAVIPPALRASARNDKRVVALGMTALVALLLSTTACDRGVEIVRDQFARR
jgi:hypothetical protein